MERTDGALPGLSLVDDIMATMRKFVVWLIAVSAVGLIYILYNRFAGTGNIRPPDSQSGNDIKVPTFDDNSARIGPAAIGTADNSRFLIYDEKTKRLKHEIGFEKLLKPDEGSGRWKPVKPYMNIYGEKFTCQITADRGNIRVETAAGKPMPTDAKLSGDVKIHFTPVAAGELTESTIYLEDMDYNAERSEFSTDGPIKVVSADAEMEGRGMLLIYNTAMDRVEYLKIEDLDYLRLRNVSNFSESDQPDKVGQTSPTSESAKTDSSPAAAEQVAQQEHSANEAVAENAGSESEKGYYYQCKLSDNVVIEYGRELIVEGVDDVTIRNILWSRHSGKEQTSGDVKPGQTATDEAEGNAQAAASQSRAVTESEDDDVEVIVRCRGDVVIKPMESILERGSARTDSEDCIVELTGRPVRIKEVTSDGRQEPVTIASCGILKYNLATDIVDMFTSANNKYISLNMAGSDALLETTGSVKWWRKSSEAKINGPGKLLVKGTNKPSGTEDRSEMRFDGVMQLFFADAGANKSMNEFVLKSANLAGGMTATIADESDSNVSAERAVFVFDQTSGIVRADLAGGVHFSSDKGRLGTEEARILFAKDTDGDSYPKTMQSTTKAVLEPVTAKDEKPARFKAQRIDYDITTGNALAAGPVEFTFYVDSNKANPNDELTPIVITARDNAEFFSDKNGNPNRVVFNGDVVGMRTNDRTEYCEKSSFYGGRMIVDLEPKGDAGGPGDIRRLTVVGGNVKLESKRFADGVTISHVRLLCRRIDHYAKNEIIIATGPGNIQLNNQNVPPPVEDPNERFSLKRPCFALIDGFDKLRWLINDNNILADGKENSINIHYLPIIDGAPGQAVHAGATHIDAGFVATQSGRYELASLTATGGVLYKEDGGNEFIGDWLTFTKKKSLLQVGGSLTRPCYLNGALARKIDYNLETDEISIEPVAGASSTFLPKGAKKNIP